MAPVDIKLRPIVISGPSGTGKSTILKRLFAAHPDRFAFSVSHTTRSPRAGEVEGKDYYYITRDAFEALIAEGGFLEHAQFGSNHYGTSVATVQKAQRAGKTCILDIEMEGVKQLKKHDENSSGAAADKPTAEGWLPARYLFVAPPSYEELERRLRGRKTDKPEEIEKRLKQARVEMEFARGEGVHDLVVVNDDLDKAYREVERFILGEE